MRVSVSLNNELCVFFGSFDGERDDESLRI